MKRYHSLVMGLGLALAIAGCGTQGLSGTAVKTMAKAGVKAAERFFPADAKAVWQYEVTAQPSDDPYTDYKGTETVTVDSLRRDGDATVITMRAIDDFTNEYRFPTVTEDASGVTIQGVEYMGVAADRIDDLSIQFLRFPLTEGARWDDGQWVGKALKKETVHVPAGTFEAWNIDVIGTYDHAYTAVGHYWVAPGKGIVKSQLSIPGWDVRAELIPAGRAKKPTRPLPNLRKH